MKKLLFIPDSFEDFMKFDKAIRESDWYCEKDSIEKYFTFEEEEPDELEKHITKIVTTNEINGHFELE